MKIIFFISLLLLIFLFWKGEVLALGCSEICKNLFFVAVELFFTYGIVEVISRNVEKNKKKPIYKRMYQMITKFYNDYTMSLQSLFSDVMDYPIELTIRMSDRSDLEDHTEKMKKLFLKNKTNAKMVDFDYIKFESINYDLEKNITFLIELLSLEMEVDVLDSIMATLQDIKALREGIMVDIDRYRDEKINGFAYGYTVNRMSTLFDLIIKQSNKKFWQIQ